MRHGLQEASNKLWSTQLADAYAREAALQQQLAACHTELAASKAAGSEAAGLLQSVRADVTKLGSQVAQLQEQLEQQQAAADAAAQLCLGQQCRADEQQEEANSLQQELAHERQARCAADAAVQQLLKQIQTHKEAMKAVATDLGDTSDQNRRQVVAGVCTSLRRQLSAAEAAQCQLEKQLEAAQRRMSLMQQQDKPEAVAVQLLQSTKRGLRHLLLHWWGTRLSPLRRLLVVVDAPPRQTTD